MRNRAMRVWTWVVALLMMQGVTALSGDGVAAWAGDGVVRVLAIGNSFSMDAVEQNLWQIAAADGQQMVIVNMYIGGCPIERHVNNIRADKADYRYCRIGVDGSRTVREGVSLASIIDEEPWDYVSVQQASHDSGLPATYALLPELVEWVRANAPTAEVVFHQTWAYAKTSTHSGFANYGRDQMKMYGAIISTSRAEARKAGIHTFIPTGTAVQNARGTALGDDLTRDGFHLSYGIGRYIAAATWYETLCHRSVVGNSYVPDGSEAGTAALTAEECRLAQKAVHKAVKRPFKVSKVKRG